MATRSYRQYCGLASAMDLLGQRWSALIVRDLVPGPRRFTDLFEGLPGVATDMLADRLRSLEAAGVVSQRTLRHPVPANVYELTDRGRDLAAVLADLARWGMGILPPPGTTDARTHPRWALQSMVGAYRGGAAAGAYTVSVDGDDLTVVVGPEGAHLEYGRAPAAIAAVAWDSVGFFRTVGAPDRERRALVRSAVTDGDVVRAVELFDSLPLRVGGG